MAVTEHVGDIFKAPEGSVLIHACNCQGNWGSGVARAFADKFPTANDIYRSHCQTPQAAQHKQSLVGTCLLIPPQYSDADFSGPYWIACLFTSLGYGAKVDKPDDILQSTRSALADLRAHIVYNEKQNPGLDLSSKLFTIRINSARFGVPWHRTRHVLEASGLGLTVVNNVNVMPAKERVEVMKDMEANGWDTDRPIDYKRIWRKPEIEVDGMEDDEEDDAARPRKRGLDGSPRLEKKRSRVL